MFREQPEIPQLENKLLSGAEAAALSSRTFRSDGMVCVCAVRCISHWTTCHYGALKMWLVSLKI